MIFDLINLRKQIYGDCLRGISRHCRIGFSYTSKRKSRQKVSIFDKFPATHLHYKYHDLESCPALPGLAWLCPGQRRPVAGIQGIPPHVPMSQYIVNLAERKLHQNTTTTTTWFSWQTPSVGGFGRIHRTGAITTLSWPSSCLLYTSPSPRD